MTSSLAWLSYDTDERDRTLQLLELFKDEGTVDDLGIGSIRDTFSDALFPGTSVIQTRARYLLFLPWLLEETVRRGRPGSTARDELRRNEIRLIHSLLRGGDDEGIIGESAKGNLKRMPSSVYWAAMRHYGIRTTGVTIDGFFREARAAVEGARRRPQTEDEGVAAGEMTPGLDAELTVSCPPPEGWLSSTTLDLAAEEASYLRDRIVTSTRGSLLSWLLVEHRRSDVAYVWNHPDRAEFPDHLGTLVDHGERFHRAIYGGFLLYNLLLAEKKQATQLVEGYRAQIAAWHEEVAEYRVWEGWQQTELWATLQANGRSLNHRTVGFVSAWIDQASRSSSIADDPALRELVARREYELKRSRSRLHNPARLDTWGGRAGVNRLEYRWGITKQIMADIFDGLEATP